MPATFRTTRRVQFGDTDTAGIVHFARFFCYMEEAEHEMLRSLGLSVVMEWQGKRLGFPRVGASCDFLRPAKFLEVIDVTVRVDSIGSKSVTYLFEFSKDGEPIARGQITAVCCRTVDDHRLESMVIPTDIRQKLQQAQ